MRFLANGPDVPRDLVLAQEKGSVVFVCGAGVSRTSGLPDFRGLVERIYQHLGEDWSIHPAERDGMEPGSELAGQYDRVLRCLERRLAASDVSRNRGMRERFRGAVRDALTLSGDADLTNHLAILELSRGTDGQVRLLTTNFDTLFERAWHEANNVPIQSHAGVALPQPNVTRCCGVLHLHGRLGDPQSPLDLGDSDLVLTSAEFGEAYLRSGWASRYIYDFVRAYTLVFVGYQANDPPMRYLLEALESDRDRFRDLHKVYAFAPCAPGEAARVDAHWKAKGVEPILYAYAGSDHSALYDTIREWRSYAADPTAWRRERLRPIISKSPSSLSDSEVEECQELLDHGDRNQILGELAPAAPWLTFVQSRHSTEPDWRSPGAWITARLDDSEMIGVVAELDALDEQAKWQISRALDQRKEDLAPVYRKAWHLVLATEPAGPIRDLSFEWHMAKGDVRLGQIDYRICQLVSKILRPKLQVRKALRSSWEPETHDGPEALHHILYVDFRPAEHPGANEIIHVWPKELEHQIALFSTLERTLQDTLEQAEDIGLLAGWDRASHDVPSIAPHAQNEHQLGFYPITRALADLWELIAASDLQLAHNLARGWLASRFLLLRRMHLFTLGNTCTDSQLAAAVILDLDDRTFWEPQAQVELMRALVLRWGGFDRTERELVEARLRAGVPREFYSEDLLRDEDEWESVHDSSIYRRLKRLESAGCTLSEDSQNVILRIEKRHPSWQASSGDRDDFSSWHESSVGPRGHSELLEDIDDRELVSSARRIQREQRFDEGDLWRAFCIADPERALRGLSFDADQGSWDSEMWLALLWESGRVERNNFQQALASLILQMPEDVLDEILPAVASWLERSHKALLGDRLEPQGQFFLVWDRLAELTFRSSAVRSTIDGGVDAVTEALNEPGGMLAGGLLAVAQDHATDGNHGIVEQVTQRLDLIVESEGRSALLARVILARNLAFLHSRVASWTIAKFRPLMSWEYQEAADLWGAYAQSSIGAPDLFNEIRDDLLRGFEGRRLADDDLEGLASKLFVICVWHRQGEHIGYELAPVDLRRVLTVGAPTVRRCVAWQLWRLMATDRGESDQFDKPPLWREIASPIFREIWPLDASLRSEESSEYLTLMALSSEDAFPEAVDAIVDFVVPFRLYSLAQSLRLEARHDRVASLYPLAFLKLVNALIDPDRYPIPGDLGQVLLECVRSEPSIKDEPQYFRLNGLLRFRNA